MNDSWGLIHQLGLSSSEEGTQEPLSPLWTVSPGNHLGRRTQTHGGPSRRHWIAARFEHKWDVCVRASLPMVHGTLQQVYRSPQRRLIFTCVLEGMKSRARLRFLKKFWGHRTLALICLIKKNHVKILPRSLYERILTWRGPLRWNANRS